MKTFIVTGGIGSGKSEVCAIISRIFGCPVYNADDRVKALYLSHPTLLSDIETGLGMNLRDGEGRFLPQVLAERIFSDRDALATVESLVFPALIADFEAWATKYEPQPFVVFESATVLEKRAFDTFGDKVIIVDAPFELRLERACARDASSKEKVLERMKNQPLMNDFSGRGYSRRTDAVILNSGSFEELEKQTVEAINKIISQKK